MVPMTISKLREMGLGDEDPIIPVVTDANGEPVEVRNNWILGQEMEVDGGKVTSTGEKRMVFAVELPAAPAGDA